MNLQEYIQQFRRAERLSIAELARVLEISSQLLGQYEKGLRKPKLDFYKKFKDKFGVDLLTIETNASQVINEKNLLQEPSIGYAPQGKFPKKIGMGSQPVPYYDVDFSAGDIELYDDKHAIQPAYMMDIPEFSGCTAFRVHSNSMEKLITSGSILFGTKVNEWVEHLEYGQIYGIVCNDKRRYLKYIRKAPHKDESHFLLKSENVTEFDDFLIAKNKIKSIWLIHGWLNKRN